MTHLPAFFNNICFFTEISMNPNSIVVGIFISYFFIIIKNNVNSFGNIKNQLNYNIVNYCF